MKTTIQYFVKHYRLNPLISKRILFLCSAFWIVVSCGIKENADLLLINGNILTMDSAQTKSEALAIRNGRILSVGTSDQIRKQYIGTQTINLEGATVLPGLTDGHIHMRTLGRFLQRLNLKHTKSYQDLLDSVRGRLQRTPSNRWIIGRGWDQNRWPDRRFPDHRPLSALSPDHFVVLTRVDGHAVLVNEKVIRLARIDASTPDPPGGQIIRYPDGTPTGLLIDNAKDLIAPFIPKPTREEDRESLELAFAHCLENGITSVQDAGVTSEILEIYHDLGQKNRLPVRIYAMLDYEDQPLLEKYFLSGPAKELYNDFLTIRSIKMYADGALGSRGAALLQPYSDSPSSFGLIVTPPEELRTAFEKALEKGFQICTHAIGDSANRLVLNLYHQVLKNKNISPQTARWRIEHAQIVHPDDFGFFRRVGIIASMQPRHCTSDMHWAEQRLGKHRLSGAYAWRTMLQNHIPLCFGSDAPVESASPLEGLHAAVTRQDPDGWPENGWLPEQCLTMMEALQAYTLNAAYAAFEENRKGSIEKGKYADLVVLSDDITRIQPKDIFSAKIRMTIVNGKVAYKRPEKKL